MRAIEVLPASSWAKETAIDHVRLTFDERNRRRLRYVALGGTEFVLDLPRATVMHDGDGLKLENGQFIAVEAAPEALAEVTAPDLQPTRILIRDDHVIVHMLEGLGATVRHLEATFTPEPGAYSGAVGHAVFAHGHEPNHHGE